MTGQNNISTPLNPDGTNPQRPVATPSAERAHLGTPVTPRSTPKGTRIIQQSPDQITLGIRYVMRFWWPYLPIGMLIFTVFAVPVIGGFIAAITGAIGFPVFLFLASIVGTIFAFTQTRGEVQVIVQPDKMKFGAKTYDRKYYNGMRLGYQIATDDNALKNDFFDKSMGMSALRLTYGPWGEDLPYLVNSYHAAEIVTWMNPLIDAVGAPPPRENAPSEGRREQSF